MSTRLKRPALWRSLLVTSLLIAFQVYLGYNVIGGQYGITSQKQMRVDIEDLKAQSASLAADGKVPEAGDQHDRHHRESHLRGQSQPVRVGLGGELRAQRD